MHGGGENGPGSRDVGDALRALKRRGCLLLLTGRTPASTSRRAVRRVLGDPGAGRRRVLVLADPERDADAYDDVPNVRVLDVRAVVREAAPDGLDVVAERLRAAVDPDGEDDADGESDPDGAAAGDGEEDDEEDDDLRVVLDDTVPLVEAWGVERVGEFLVDLGEFARATRAIVAARLDLDESDPVAAGLADRSDLRVELRHDCDGDGPCQRVHLPGREPSAWTPL